MSYSQAFSSFYAKSFDKRPWLTLAVTNGILGMIADGAAQTLERVNNQNQKNQVKIQQQQESTSLSSTTDSSIPWDWERTTRFLCFNVTMAPLLAEWNKLIEVKFPLRSSSSSLTAVSVVKSVTTRISLRQLGNRVFVDQLLFAPFGLAMFTAFMGFFETRGDIQGIKAKFSQMYMPALIANYQVWPIVQIINFRFMPLKYRVPFVSTVGIFWNISLSLLSSATRNSSTHTKVIVNAN